MKSPGDRARIEEGVHYVYVSNSCADCLEAKQLLLLFDMMVVEATAKSRNHGSSSYTLGKSASLNEFLHNANEVYDIGEEEDTTIPNSPSYFFTTNDIQKFAASKESEIFSTHFRVEDWLTAQVEGASASLLESPPMFELKDSNGTGKPTYLTRPAHQSVNIIVPDLLDIGSNRARPMPLMIRKLPTAETSKRKTSLVSVSSSLSSGFGSTSMSCSICLIML